MRARNVHVSSSLHPLCIRCWLAQMHGYQTEESENSPAPSTIRCREECAARLTKPSSAAEDEASTQQRYTATHQML